MLKRMLGVFGVYALILAMLGTVVYIKLGVWEECRVTNSFWYCWMLMGK